MKTRAPQRFIYVIGPLEGAQKIGLSTDPKARLATLQTGCPQDLVLHVAVRVPFELAHDVERRAHRMLAGSHALNEWFDTTPDAAMEVVLAAVRPPKMPLAQIARELRTGGKLSVEVLPLFAFRKPDPQWCR